MQLLALRADQGRLGEVEQSLEEFARRYPATPVWRAAAAFAMSTSGAADDARRAYESLSEGGLAGVPRDAEWLSTVAFLVRTGEVLGDAPRSAALGELLLPYADRAVITGRGSTCLGPISRHIAIAWATAGRREEAIEQFEAALATANRWGADPQVAAISFELADVSNRATPLVRAWRARDRAARAGPADRSPAGSARAAQLLGAAGGGSAGAGRRDRRRRPSPRARRSSSNAPRRRSRSTGAATSGRSGARAAGSSCATRRG